MARSIVWATKVYALIEGGNSKAALAQIKVAPTVQDLKDLRAMLQAAKLLTKHANVDTAILDTISALSGSRLHRSP